MDKDHYVEKSSSQIPWVLEEVCHQVARPEEPRADARFGNAEDGGNLDAGEFLKGRKHQHLALFSGELIDASEHMGMMLGGRGAGFCTETAGGKTRASSATSSVSGRVLARRLRS